MIVYNVSVTGKVVKDVIQESEFDGKKTKKRVLLLMQDEAMSLFKIVVPDDYKRDISKEYETFKGDIVTGNFKGREWSHLKVK